MDVPSSCSISGLKSVSCSLSWAGTSRANNSAQGIDVCEYAYPAGKLKILRHCAPEELPVEAGGVPGRDGVGSGVCRLHWLHRGVPVPLRLQHVCGLFVVAFWQGSHSGLWF